MLVLSFSPRSEKGYHSQYTGCWNPCSVHVISLGSSGNFTRIVETTLPYIGDTGLPALFDLWSPSKGVTWPSLRHASVTSFELKVLDAFAGLDPPLAFRTCPNPRPRCFRLPSESSCRAIPHVMRLTGTARTSSEQ